ncbi:hypothetical protein E4U22_004319 [Claviceps purpurea]|nr:hypothetical protein E4U22_004319 [Claviceps purpurea]
MDERLPPGPKKKMRNMTFRKISHKKLIERKEWLDDYSLSYPESNDEYFAGFSIIVAGDFYQLPPVSGTAIFEPRAKTTIGMAAPVTFYALETRTDYFEEHSTGRLSLCYAGERLRHELLAATRSECTCLTSPRTA